MTPEENKNELTNSLNKVIDNSFFNYRGRVVEKTSDGFIMSGIKFKTLEEIDEAMNILLGEWAKTIK